MIIFVRFDNELIMTKFHKIIFFSFESLQYVKLYHINIFKKYLFFDMYPVSWTHKFIG